MQALIADLLTLSRAGTRPLAPVPTELGAVLTTVLRALQPAIIESGAEVADARRSERARR